MSRLNPRLPRTGTSGEPNACTVRSLTSGFLQYEQEQCLLLKSLQESKDQIDRFWSQFSSENHVERRRTSSTSTIPDIEKAENEVNSNKIFIQTLRMNAKERELEHMRRELEGLNAALQTAIDLYKKSQDAQQNQLLLTQI